MQLTNALAKEIHNHCMKCSILTIPYVELCLSMIGTNAMDNHATLWCWKEGHETQVLLELPILPFPTETPSSSASSASSLTSSSASFDYFYDTLEEVDRCIFV